jgi:hypothetical protein
MATFSVRWVRHHGILYDSALEAQETARGVREQAKRSVHRARILEDVAKKPRRSAPTADTKAVRPPAKAGRAARRARTA